MIETVNGAPTGVQAGVAESSRPELPGLRRLGRVDPIVGLAAGIITSRDVYDDDELEEFRRLARFGSPGDTLRRLKPLAGEWKPGSGTTSSTAEAQIQPESFHDNPIPDQGVVFQADQIIS